MACISPGEKTPRISLMKRVFFCEKSHKHIESAVYEMIKLMAEFFKYQGYAVIQEGITIEDISGVGNETGRKSFSFTFEDITETGMEREIKESRQESSFDLLALIRKQLQWEPIPAAAGAEPEEPSVQEIVEPELQELQKETTAPEFRTVLAKYALFAAVLAVAVLIYFMYSARPTTVSDPADSMVTVEGPSQGQTGGLEEIQPPVVVNEILSVAIPRQETYLPFGGTQQFEVVLEIEGEVDESIVWSSSDTTVAEISEDGLVTGIGNGTVTITAKTTNNLTATSEVVVTDCIILPSNEYKKFIPAYYYTPEEAELMDRILASRINDAGGPGTRGAVVAAARFITLEMPYMIPYFYENGRMDPNPGRPVCDGEGRYYHVGLYLSEAKFETIARSVAGPAIWGAPLTNFETAGYFTAGHRYPNGLDCSGYVSWAMVNGGIDTGDIGAGNYYGIEKEFYDIGERLPLSPELLLSGEIKPGDLIGIDGHIAIICGLDSKYIWISESYYRGVNTVCFTINRGVMNCQEYDFVIKMDHMYYAGQGTYTDTWVTSEE